MYIVQIKLDSELLKENLNLQAWNPKVAKDLTPFSSSTALFASCASLAYFGGTVLQCTHIILDQQNGKARDCPFPHASKQMHTNKRTVHGHREPQREREYVCVPECSHLPPPVRPFLSEKDERLHLGGGGRPRIRIFWVPFTPVKKEGAKALEVFHS
jgi:hypothetical protein